MTDNNKDNLAVTDLETKQPGAPTAKETKAAFEKGNEAKSSGEKTTVVSTTRSIQDNKTTLSTQNIKPVSEVETPEPGVEEDSYVTCRGEGFGGATRMLRSEFDKMQKEKAEKEKAEK